MSPLLVALLPHPIKIKGRVRDVSFSSEEDEEDRRYLDELDQQKRERKLEAKRLAEKERRRLKGDEIKAYKRAHPEEKAVVLARYKRWRERNLLWRRAYNAEWMRNYNRRKREANRNHSVKGQDSPVDRSASQSALS